MKKKRNKKYVPKLVRTNPLAGFNAFELELPNLLAVETLGTGDFQEGFLYDLIAHGNIVSKLKSPASVQDAARRLLDACVAIRGRQTRLGKLGASGEELTTIKEALPATMAFLKSQHRTAIHRAAATVMVEFETKGYIKL